MITVTCRTVKHFVLDLDTGDDDEEAAEVKVWDEIAFLKDVFEPIHALLRRTDSRAPMMGKFYKQMSDLGGILDDLFEAPSKWSVEPWVHYKDTVSQLHLQRWNYVHCSYHAAGYALDPAYLADDVAGINDGEVMHGLMEVIERTHCNDEEARANALLQFNQFRAQTGVFGRPAARDFARQVPAHEYWNMVGGEAAALRKVAMRVLSKGTSASASERNWSAFEAVQSPKRNRLKTSTLNDLVYTRVNLRLMQARHDAEYTTTVADWAAESLADAAADAEEPELDADHSDEEADADNDDAGDDDDVEVLAVVTAVEPANTAAATAASAASVSSA
jgi:hypothetical protein